YFSDATAPLYIPTRSLHDALPILVHWAEYATRSVPTASFLSMPCTFPDLRDDRLLKGAVRHTVEHQLRSLESQKEHGAFVQRLIELGQQLLRRVQTVPAYVPSSTTLGV